MPQSHLHVKLSRKNHAIIFSQNGVGRGYLVVVTGVYVAITGSVMLSTVSTWRLLVALLHALRTSHERPVIVT